MNQMFIDIRRGDGFHHVHEINAVQTIIGRKIECEILLPEPCISRHHASLIRRDATLFVRDLGSINGTFLNGKRIVCEERIHPKDQLKIGPYQLTPISSFATAILEIESDRASTIAQEQHRLESKKLVERLTPAQRRVFSLFMQGLMEKEVAAQLEISIHTVHAHAKAIYKTLSVSTRGELFAMANDGHA